jgi:hypothetical protein
LDFSNHNLEHHLGGQCAQPQHSRTVVAFWSEESTDHSFAFTSVNAVVGDKAIGVIVVIGVIVGLVWMLEQPVAIIEGIINKGTKSTAEKSLATSLP